MDPHRKLWNDRHQKLHRALSKGDRAAALELFLDQHAMLHAAKVSRSNKARRGSPTPASDLTAGLHDSERTRTGVSRRAEPMWSFEDELLHDLTAAEIRQIASGGQHSIAWILLHLARIEDITMNLLVAGTGQLFTRQGWAKKMKIAVLHSANRMDGTDVAELSKTIDIKALRAYRAAVGKRTRQIVQKLQAADFQRKVDPARIERVLREGAVSPEALEITKYWGKKTLAGLLLMPPTRHCILHLNEGMRVKAKIRKEK